MATNNYYGFTHAGTQYGTQYTPSTNNLPVVGTGAQYSQQYTSVQGAAVPPPQTYPGSADQNNYAIGGYTRSIAQAAPQNQQAYYTSQPPNSIGTIGQQPQQQQVYSTISAGSSTGAGYQSYLTPVTIQPQTTSSTAPGKTPSFTNYDAAVYNAVTAYAQGTSGSAGRNQGGPKGRRYFDAKSKPKIPSNKPLTLHYCDVCKISCAGPQTYKEHLEGQKHKKKELSLKSATASTSNKGSPVGLRCELCDVVCTGSDAYAAHIRGAKHQKVLKLHTKLGKAIPSDNPTVVASAATSGLSTPKQGQAQRPGTGNAANSIKNATNNSGVKFAKPATPPAAAAPKISFVGSKSDNERFLSTTAAPKNDASELSTSYPLPTVSSGTITPAGCSTPMLVINASSTPSSQGSVVEFQDRDKDIQPVGQDYIEEIRNEDGKGVSFNCKLCDCKFNDPNAKEMHMKGRRHRLQYKKKVNPQLIVDMKPSSRQKKIDERKLRPGLGSAGMMGRRGPEG